MGINIRVKGATGEREIATDLNEIIFDEMGKFGLVPIKNYVQRNQNQSAVGGSDLTGTFGLSIEVKRQEALSINTWWKQCTISADRANETPILIYRQNGKKWRCVLMCELPLPFHDGAANGSARCEISYDDFKSYFRETVRRKLISGDRPSV